MTCRLPIRLSPAAAEQIAVISDWWRDNRPAAASFFLDELERAFDLIRRQPNIGQIVTGAKSDRIRRVCLRRSRYHIYYQESDEGEAIDLLTVWHTSRSEPPL